MMVGVCTRAIRNRCYSYFNSFETDPYVITQFENVYIKKGLYSYVRVTDDRGTCTFHYQHNSLHLGRPFKAGRSLLLKARTIYTKISTMNIR